MPSYKYRVIPKVVEDEYLNNTGKNIYYALGNVDFGKALLIVTAENKLEAENIRKGVTDIRMWVEESVED